MTQKVTYNYVESIKAIKQAILRSRYKAAMLVNKEMLMLYFGIGEYISKNSRKGSWGTNAIEMISWQLQKELPGLRGFSARNIKNMRAFYEAWKNVFLIRQLSTADLQVIDNETPIRQMSSAELETNGRCYLPHSKRTATRIQRNFTRCRKIKRIIKIDIKTKTNDNKIC
jgi:hypothetical protein